MLNKRMKSLAANESKWNLCRDVREGQSAIHSAGTAYLPKLHGQDDKSYKAMVSRSCFYGAFSRTIDALSGMVMRVDPHSEGFFFVDDVTNSGIDLHEFANAALTENLIVGGGAILVDYDVAPEQLTMADAEKSGYRPYAVLYKAENVISYKMSKGEVIQAVLYSPADVQKDEFTTEVQERWLVLDLQGGYRQRLFVKKENGDIVQDGEDKYPILNGKKINEIPLFLFGDLESSPPLIDLAYLNVSHYQSTADLEHGCHYVALPTPVITGHHLGENESIKLGADTALVLPSSNASATMLEFSGAGLSAIESRIKAKEQMMAALGAKMLSEVTVQETATAAGIRSAGELSVLANISVSLSKVLTNMARFMHIWAGYSADFEIKLNTDFIPQKMDAQTLQALVMSWQTGAISYGTLFSNLQKGEIIAANATAEDEQAAIIETQPVLTV